MQARIVRDERVQPGGEGVVELPGEILFVVSAAGVTQDGAECLQEGWAWFIRRGEWRYGHSGGAALEVTYRRLVLPGEVAVRIASSPGHVECLLSPSHFTRGSVNGLQVAVRASVRSGWRQYSVQQPAARQAS